MGMLQTERTWKEKPVSTFVSNLRRDTDTDTSNATATSSDDGLHAHHNDITGWPEPASSREAIKRDLSARHINMIALAGMIVREFYSIY